MTISAEQVKNLREKTGAGMMECKKALSEARGDLEAAMTLLREQGIRVAESKSARVTSAGIISSYIHPPGRIGVLLEVNCETDFVASTEIFQNLTRELALQIAAANPRWTCREEAPAEIVEKEKAIAVAAAQKEGKPEKLLQKIAEGRLEKFFREMCLMEQIHIRDVGGKKSVAALVQEAISTLKENIRVRRFCRFEVGKE